jgi:hypothetical protein
VVGELLGLTLAALAGLGAVTDFCVPCWLLQRWTGRPARPA